MLFKVLAAFLKFFAADPPSSALTQRYLAQCDFVFIPETSAAIPQGISALAVDFNRIPEVVLFGMDEQATFAEASPEVFLAHKAFYAKGWTCDQTIGQLEHLIGKSLEDSTTGLRWNIQSIQCSCDLNHED